MPVPVSIDVRSAVDTLIARQCHALDAQDFQAYGETFGPDGIFENRATGSTLHSRGEIVASSVQHAIARVPTLTRFRHYVFNTSCVWISDTEILAQSTTLIVRTQDGQSAALALLRCHDRIEMGPWMTAGPEFSQNDGRQQPKILHRLVSRFRVGQSQ
jgi:hypothetical protein